MGLNQVGKKERIPESKCGKDCGNIHLIKKYFKKIAKLLLFRPSHENLTNELVRELLKRTPNYDKVGLLTTALPCSH